MDDPGEAGVDSSKHDELEAIKFRMNTAEFTQAAASITGPLWWSIPGADVGKDRRSGTAFFARTEKRLIGVTAAHVVNGWKLARESHDVSTLCLTGPSKWTMELKWEIHEITCHAGLDIATFSIEEEDLARLGFACLPYSSEPSQPAVDDWITYCGFPGAIRDRPTPTATVFRMCVATGKVSALSDRRLTIQLERNDLQPMWPGGMPPQGFSFGGMSGGPVFRNLADRDGHLQAVLAGVISDGRGADVDDDGKPVQRIEGLELITASRAEFILHDGTLDTDRWDGLP